MAETASVKKQNPVGMPERMGLAEDKRHDWVFDLPVGLKIEDVLEPSYWAHLASQMDPLDHIEVRAEDGSWVAYLVVAYCERNYAKVKLDRLVKLEDDQEAPITSIKHKVEWKGPHMKFCVIRLSDSAVLQQGMRDKAMANQWMVEHEKTLSRSM